MVAVGAWTSGYLTGSTVELQRVARKAEAEYPSSQCGPLTLYPRRPVEEPATLQQIAVPAGVRPSGVPVNAVFLDLRTARTITPYSNLDLGVILINPEGSALRIQGVQARSIYDMPRDLIALIDTEAQKELERERERGRRLE